jgi:membrane protein DedA with SNARE-associated domain
MSALLDRFVVWGQQLVETLGYLGLSIIMFFENVFPPIPSEPFLLGAGFTSGRGEFSITAAIIAATAGATLGTAVYYYVGVLLPEERIRQLLRRYGRYALLGEEDLDRALVWFRRHGRPVIFFGRCIPLVRALISVPAGMARMPFGQFAVYTVAGTALWSALLIVAGRLLGENWESALALLDRYEQVAIALGVLAVVAFLVKRFTTMRNRRRNTNPAVTTWGPGPTRPAPGSTPHGTTSPGTTPPGRSPRGGVSDGDPQEARGSRSGRRSM